MMQPMPNMGIRAAMPNNNMMYQQPSSMAIPPNQPGVLAPATATASGLAAAAGAAATKASEAAPAVKRHKRRRPYDADHERALSTIPESKYFTQLLELNRIMDDAIQRLRSEARTAIANPPHVRKRLRLYVHNTHAHQPPAAAAATAAAASAGVGTAPNPDPPCWSLQIVGRLLDGPDGALPGAAAAAAGPHAVAVLAGQAGHGFGGGGTGGHHHTPRQPLTAYLRRVEVRLDEAQYPGAQGLFVWDRALHGSAPHRDAIEVRRAGSANVNAQISIEVDWQPERVTVPPALAELLGVQYDTRVHVMTRLWQYIKLKRLQDPQKPQVVALNPPLAAVFGCNTLNLATLADRLGALLQKVPPIIVNHIVRVDGRSPAPPQCYDLDIDLPSCSASDKLSPNLDRFNKDREIESLDASITAGIRAINEHRRRRNIFLAFSQSPVDFINALVASQHDDLRIAAAADGRSYDLQRRGEVFKQRWVEDAVVKYVQKRLAAGHH